MSYSEMECVLLLCCADAVPGLPALTWPAWPFGLNGDCADAEFPGVVVKFEQLVEPLPPPVPGWPGSRSSRASLRAAERLDVRAPRTYVRAMAHPSGLTEERLALLYDAEGFGGETTIRAKVVRELIDEIRLLRSELIDAEARPEGPRTGG